MLKPNLQNGLDQTAPEDCYNRLGSIIIATLVVIRFKELEADCFQILEHQVQLTPLHKLWIAWRIARRLKILPNNQ